MFETRREINGRKYKVGIVDIDAVHHIPTLKVYVENQQEPILSQERFLWEKDEKAILKGWTCAEAHAKSSDNSQT